MEISNSNYSPSFGKINLLYGRHLSKGLVSAINNSDAVKYFGRKYNADAYVMQYIEIDNIYQPKYMLRFENIKPKNIFKRVNNFFKYNFASVYFDLTTRATNQKQLAQSITEMDKKSIVKLYEAIDFLG